MSFSSVSVVIPTYNRGRLVAQAVASALAQSVPPLEVIIVDKGSTDDTHDRLRPYLARIVYCHQADEGISAARNQGIRAAQGKFIAFLDSDDLWHPRKLELQLKVFEERPELGLLGTGGIQRPDPRFPDTDYNHHGRVSRVSWDQLVVKNRLGTSSVMVRSEVLNAAGGFDTSQVRAEDRDLWIRIAKVAPVARLDLPLVGWRPSPGGLSEDAEKSQIGMLRIMRALDRQSSWEGNHWLRRKAYGCVYNECAYMYMHNRGYARAILNLVRSFAHYPFPFRREEVNTPLERPKRLIVAALRMLRLKPDEPEHPRLSASQSALSLDRGVVLAIPTSSDSDRR
jgi:glycosyltransferase involved in cell wall biosynthesis